MSLSLSCGKILTSFLPAFLYTHFLTAENIGNVCKDFFVLLITISQYLNEFVDQLLLFWQGVKFFSNFCIVTDSIVYLNCFKCILNSHLAVEYLLCNIILICKCKCGGGGGEKLNTLPYPIGLINICQYMYFSTLIIVTI